MVLSASCLGFLPEQETDNTYIFQIVRISIQ